MAKKLKFIQVGMGPIGINIARNLMERENVECVAAVEIDPDKIGRDVSDILKLAEPTGVRVAGDAEFALANSDADVVILATVSSFIKLEEQLMLCIKHKKNVVSSCEEMAYPWDEHPSESRRIDAAAKEAGVTVLGTGVNPGFAMDALPVFLSSVCRKVDSIRVERYQDASRRRLPFQEKIGAGLSLDDFKAKVEAKIIRHVGFTESVQMIAKALGWTLDRVEDIVEPAIAERELASQYLAVPEGAASGLLQTATGYRNGKPVITIELQAYLGHPTPKDSVFIDGIPSVYSEVKGGFNGDAATCAIVANSVPVVCRAEPGLKTMLDVGLVSWFEGVSTGNGP